MSSRPPLANLASAARSLMADVVLLFRPVVSLRTVVLHEISLVKPLAKGASFPTMLTCSVANTDHVLCVCFEL